LESCLTKLLTSRTSFNKNKENIPKFLKSTRYLTNQFYPQSLLIITWETAEQESLLNSSQINLFTMCYLSQINVAANKLQKNIEWLFTIYLLKYYINLIIIFIFKSNWLTIMIDSISRKLYIIYKKNILNFHINNFLIISFYHKNIYIYIYII
jgi:hypothetical protein